MLWDTHMHTRFSGDSDADPEQMIAAARKKGLSGLCFTDHLDYDYPKEPDLFLLDLPSYKEGMLRLKESYAGEFPVFFGIELGLQPQAAAKNRSVSDSFPFDFIIGSSHVVHGTDPYYNVYYDGRTEDEAYREYFESILENLHTDVDFDVYGHIDYVVRYGPNRNSFYSYEKFSDVIDEILKTLIDMGKGIEINTGGFKYGLGHPNPTEAIIRRYRKLGGEIITIGSDAHAPEHVGYAFEKVPDILRTAGFHYFTVFKNRRPQFLPLEV